MSKDADHIQRGENVVRDVDEENSKDANRLPETQMQVLTNRFPEETRMQQITPRFPET